MENKAFYEFKNHLGEQLDILWKEAKGKNLLQIMEFPKGLDNVYFFSHI